MASLIKWWALQQLKQPSKTKCPTSEEFCVRSRVVSGARRLLRGYKSSFLQWRKGHFQYLYIIYKNYPFWWVISQNMFPEKLSSLFSSSHNLPPNINFLLWGNMLNSKKVLRMSAWPPGDFWLKYVILRNEHYQGEPSTALLNSSDGIWALKTLIGWN